jgi:amidophosphoribosyltransferase
VIEGKLREKCAVAAVVGNGDQDMAGYVYESLFAMQHRGAEASGIVSGDSEGRFNEHRGSGLVRDIYDLPAIQKLSGSLAIGHNRYSTNGSKTAHMQPYIDSSLEFGFAHNGNLPVVGPLKQLLEKNNIKTDRFNDSEMMGLAVARFIANGNSLPDAVELAYPYFQGAFSCVAIHDGMVVAFRDRQGIRPLALGSFEGGRVVASETCGLDIIDAVYDREVEPGEMIMLTKDGIESRRLAESDSKLDIFEFVYFARHDSNLYGQSVNAVRRHFGQQLAKEHPLTDHADNRIVVPIPDTSGPAAEGYAEAIGLSLRAAVIKNRYIGRTFMQPTNEVRSKQLRRKHNIIPGEVKGKDVIFIDDSIVRLNTMPRLVELAKDCGAKSVSVLIASPPVRFPDHYGIDTPDQKELAAAHMTNEEIRKQINCEYLGYLSLGGTVAATGIAAEKFNLSCFTGEYPISIGEHADHITRPVSMEGIE